MSTQVMTFRRQPPVTTYTLAGINAAVWALVMATGGGSSEWLARLHLRLAGFCQVVGDPGMYYRVSQAECATYGDGLWAPGAADGAWYLALTSAFTHVEVWHIGVNMLSLLALGPLLEAVLGRVTFVITYLAAAIGGSACVVWLSAPDVSTVGASGAIWGLVGVYAAMARQLSIDRNWLLITLLINVSISFAPGISWQAHAGGFVVGLLAGSVFAEVRPTRTRVLVVLGLAVMAAGVFIWRALMYGA